MSYILEALRRSQQERELGQVPTLETAAFPSDKAKARPGPWLMAAVGLAMLAVLIALYAALRAPHPQADAALSPTEQEPAAPRPTAAAPPTPLPRLPADRPAEPKPEASPESSVAEEPSARQAPRSKPEAPAVAAPARPRPKPAAAIPERPAKEKIPEDLRRDIEAFKDQVRQERSGKGEKKPAAQGNKARSGTQPQDLRLPSEIRSRLPAFFMSAHVYDKDPGKRFVLINSLKHRQGDKSREGIGVEEILPDGAVLSFEGHSFFQER